jgi:hypothetical protein
MDAGGPLSLSKEPAIGPSPGSDDSSADQPFLFHTNNF